VLRTELRRDHPEQAAELHRRAADWSEREGMVTEAVRHAVEAGDWQWACASVVCALAIGDLLAGRLTTQLTSLFAARPGPGERAARGAPPAVRRRRAMAAPDAGGVARPRRAARLARPAAGDRSAVRPGVAAERRDPPPGLVEPLTEREQTVLARMAEAKSTDDIAAELYLSINTVRTHQKNIHRKLSVARRNDAVRRGRQLGLI
jgi:ATP/maltotriose-dependent transcriptional regulator MalT